MQSKLRSVLENVLNQAHPDKAGLFLELLRKIPDLRTLNTLHSEKLLAFKMTEQQQQQQQQHYNHHAQQQTPPPTASPWHNDRDSYDEEGGAKSPMGSVSSSGAESICSGVEGTSSMSDLPLLAAVAGSAVPLMSGGSHRRRLRGPSENGSSSMSSDGEEMDSAGRSLMRMVESPPRTHSAGAGSNAGSSCPYSKMRKLDSPDDSGIESGVDRYEKMSTASRSTNTSLCSSPRSSLEDKVKEVDEMQHHHQHHHHAAPSAGGRVGQSSVDDMPVLKRVLQAPPLFDTNSLMDEAYKPHKKFRALTRCAGSKGEESPMRVPAVSSPPRSSPTSSSSSSSSSTSTVSVLSAALSSPPGTYSALCSALTSPPSSSSSSSLLASSLSSGVVSSLTSTHSTLARSLMEGPKMVSTEQQRRADLIVANIMKGNVTGSSPTPSSSSQNYSPLSSSSNGQQQQQQRTVLTSGPLYAGSSSPSSWNYHHHQRSSPVSPPHNHSSPSPGSSRIPQQQQQQQQTESVSSVGADSQPLNLSLKSPSSSPARPTTPVTQHNNTHYFPLHA